jgi:hypothetical protein
MFPAVYAPHDGKGTVTERRLFARLQSELDGSWQVIHDAALGFVLLHRDLGIALLASDGTDPSEVVAALRARLDAIGFTRNFQADIAVVAEIFDPQDRRDLFAVLAAAFSAVAPATPTDPTWPDWLVQRLAVPLSARPGEGAEPATLRAPERADSWHAGAAPVPVARDAAMRVVPERRLHAEDLDTRSPLWTGAVLAVLVVAVVLGAMALLSHHDGAGDPPPPAAAGAR